MESRLVKCVGSFAVERNDFPTTKDVWKRLSFENLSAEVLLKHQWCDGKTEIILVGDPNLTRDSMRKIEKNIKEIEVRIQEEKDTKDTVMKLKHHEAKYIEITKQLDSLHQRFNLKELKLDGKPPNQQLHIKGHHSVVDEVWKAVENIKGSMVKESVRKSQPYLKMCGDCGKIIEKSLKESKVLAVCDVEGSSLVAYAGSLEQARGALDCIQRVVWDAEYPPERPFTQPEAELLKTNAKEWQTLIHKQLKEITSPVEVIETLQGKFMVIGVNAQHKVDVFDAMDSFFTSRLLQSKTISGDRRRMEYLIKFSMSDLDAIEKECKTKLTYTDSSVKLTGTLPDIQRAESALMRHHDSVIVEQHDVEGKHNIDIITQDPTMLDDIGTICKTLIIHENAPAPKDDDITQQADIRELFNLRLPSGMRLIYRKLNAMEVKDCDCLILPVDTTLFSRPCYSKSVINKGRLV